MCALDAEPIGVRTVVRKMESGVIHVNATKLLEVVAGFTYPYSAALPVPQAKDSDLELRLVENAPSDRVSRLLPWPTRELQRELNATLGTRALPDAAELSHDPSVPRTKRRSHLG